LDEVRDVGDGVRPKYAAFLRAINVGGHVVTMERLRKVFVAAGFDEVETFIASGNVVFGAADRAAPASLERRIAAALEAALGYEVATFVRTMDEVRAIAAYKPFPAAALAAPGASLYAGFLAEPLGAPSKRALLAMRTEVDDLHLRGREIYWLGRRGFANAEFAPVKMEKALKIQATFRNVTTVRKMAAKFAGRPPVG
jgi:uncharacterized protein (DUF1697 family)